MILTGVVIMTVGAFLLALDNIRLRRQLRRELCERAEQAARALGDGMVRIDGHVLPDPTDARWASGERTVRSTRATTSGIVQEKREEPMLILGAVSVAEDHVYIHDPKVDAPALPSSAALVRYRDAVWRAHRERLVRKSMEAK